MVWRGNDEGIKILALQQFADVADHFRLALLHFGYGVQALFNGAILHITDVGDLGAGQFCHYLGQPVTAGVYAHYGEDYFVGRCCFAQQREIKQGKA